MAKKCERYMRSIGKTILSVILSLMVVYLVGGVTVVRCMHSGVTTLVTFANSDDNNACEDKCDDDCTQESSCLKLLVKKLSSAVDSHPDIHDFAIIQPLLYVMCNDFVCMWKAEHFCTVYSLCGLIMPPKVYLNLICILRI